MPNVDYITLREIQRNPKKISEKLNEGDLSYVVMGNNRPQFVIMSLKNFSKIQKPTEQNEGISLMGLIDWAEEKNIEGPADMSENHNRDIKG